MHYFFTLLATVLFSFHAMSQACSPPTITFPPTCSDAATELTADNTVIGSGEIYYTDGSPAGFTGIQINDGGILRICGGTSGTPVTFTNTTFNQGQIIIYSGANVFFDGQYQTGSDAAGDVFYNLGSVTFSATLNSATSGVLNIQGSNRVTYNGPGSTFSSGVPISMNNGNFYNDGVASAPEIRLQDGLLCMGNGSSLAVTTITSLDPAGPITVASGTACLSFSDIGTSAQPVTLQTSSGLLLCNQGPDIPTTPPGSNLVGTANLIEPCTNCSLLLLPVTLLSFSGNLLDNTATLEWETVSEEQVKSFVIERSYNGNQFEKIGEVTAYNQPSKYNFTTTVDKDSYFRLKMPDIDGQFTYSRIILLKFGTRSNEVRLLVNPVMKSYTEVSIDLSRSQTGEIVIVDNVGKTIRRIQTTLKKGNNVLLIDISNTSRGLYYIYFRGSDTRLKAAQFIKL